jgi:hypothetical protein
VLRESAATFTDADELVFDWQWVDTSTAMGQIACAKPGQLGVGRVKKDALYACQLLLSPFLLECIKGCKGSKIQFEALLQPSQVMPFSMILVSSFALDVLLWLVRTHMLKLQLITAGKQVSQDAQQYIYLSIFLSFFLSICICICIYMYTYICNIYVCINNKYGRVWDRNHASSTVDCTMARAKCSLAAALGRAEILKWRKVRRA